MKLGGGVAAEYSLNFKGRMIINKQAFVRNDTAFEEKLKGGDSTFFKLRVTFQPSADIPADTVGAVLSS